MIKTQSNKNKPMNGSIGKRISQKRKEMKLTQKELEIMCGWSGDGVRICNYERDLREPGSYEIRIIANVLKVTPWFLAYGVTLDGEDNNVDIKDFKEDIVDKEIPVLLLNEVENWVQGRITNKNKKGIFMIDSNRFSKVEGHFCVEIAGDAMISPSNPIDSYINGETAVVNTDLTPKEGDVVIFSHKNSVKIRKISKDGSENVLTALNPQYPVIMMDDEVRILGIIISTERKRYKP